MPYGIPYLPAASRSTCAISFAAASSSFAVERSRPTISTSAGTSQQPEGLENAGHDPAGNEPEHDKHDEGAGDLPNRVDCGVPFVGRRWIAPEHETGDDDAEGAGIAVHRDRPHRIVDLELAFDPVVQLVGEPRCRHADQHRLDRMVEVVAGRCADHAGEAAGIGPERIAFRDQVGHHQAARQRHQEVEGDGRCRGRCEIDVGRRPEQFVIPTSVPTSQIGILQAT